MKKNLIVQKDKAARHQTSSTATPFTSSRGGSVRHVARRCSVGAISLTLTMSCPWRGWRSYREQIAKYDAVCSTLRGSVLSWGA